MKLQEPSCKVWTPPKLQDQASDELGLDRQAVRVFFPMPFLGIPSGPCQKNKTVDSRVSSCTFAARLGIIGASVALFVVKSISSQTEIYPVQNWSLKMP